MGRPMNAAAHDLLASRAGETADLLRRIANQNRLLLLCHILDQGEITVGELSRRAGFSQSTTSQHLMLLRREALVAARRQGTVVHYRVADSRVAQIMTGLNRLLHAA